MGGGLGPAAHAELAVDPRGVVHDRLGSEVEAPGDLVVGVTVGQRSTSSSRAVRAGEGIGDTDASGPGPVAGGSTDGGRTTVSRSATSMAAARVSGQDQAAPVAVARRWSDARIYVVDGQR